MMNRGWEIAQGVEVASTQWWPARGTNDVAADDVRLKEVDQTPCRGSKDRIETARERVRASSRCKFENEARSRRWVRLRFPPREANLMFEPRAVGEITPQAIRPHRDG